MNLNNMTWFNFRNVLLSTTKNVTVRKTLVKKTQFNKKSGHDSFNLKQDMNKNEEKTHALTHARTHTRTHAHTHKP